MSDPLEEVSIAQAAGQLRDLGVQLGDVLLVHTSFRAVRPIEEGPLGLIEALSLSLGPEGTLVMPSWSEDDDQLFDAQSSPVATELGVVASMFQQLPSVERSDHHFAFAARGAKATRILRDGIATPPHRRDSPIGRIWEEDGRILLLGVDHDSNTTLHLTELLAGVPYRQKKNVTVLIEGRTVRLNYLENDHCCQLFRLADQWMKQEGFQCEGLVGHAPSKLMRSRDLIEIVVPRLKRDLFTFLHPRGSGCADCEESWKSVNV